jgi:hypothetical protein
MFIVDCGANGSTLYDSDIDKVKSISHTEVLALPFVLPFGSYVVSEYAHLGCPRKKLSRSQPFEEHELLKLYKDFAEHGITLRLFPQKSTPRAMNYSKQQFKSDFDDPKSIYMLLKAFPEISLMFPPRQFGTSNIRQESYDHKSLSNDILNIGRGRKDRYDDKKDANVEFIHSHMDEIFSRLSPDAIAAFTKEKENTYMYKKTGRVNINKLKIAQIYTIMVMLQDYDGTLRVRQCSGELPGWKFIKRYGLCMTPFHFRGGVARSNTYYHSLRHWVATESAKELGMTKKEFLNKRRGGYFLNEDQKGKGKKGDYIVGFTKLEDDTYLKYRRKYCRCLKELFMICKSILERENNLGVQQLIPHEELVTV